MSIKGIETHENSPNHWDGRRGWKPDMIVCHITDGSYSGKIRRVIHK